VSGTYGVILVELGTDTIHRLPQTLVVRRSTCVVVTGSQL
jgi:hypothetical protein